MALRGRNSAWWKGGVKIVQGYRWIKVYGRDRPNQGYVPEHVLMAMLVLDRPLRGEEEVHHFNEDRSDNRPSNLVICQDRAYHQLLHRRARAYYATGHADWILCNKCKTYGPPEGMRARLRKNRKTEQYHYFHKETQECATTATAAGKA